MLANGPGLTWTEAEVALLSGELPEPRQVRSVKANDLNRLECRCASSVLRLGAPAADPEGVAAAWAAAHGDDATDVPSVVTDCADEVVDCPDVLAGWCAPAG